MIGIFLLLIYIMIGSWLAGDHPEPFDMLFSWPIILIKEMKS